MNNKHKAICTFADSRDTDVSHTNEKWYLDIDFDAKKVNDEIRVSDIVNSKQI
jgi:hypothetical protein